MILHNKNETKSEGDVKRMFKKISMITAMSTALIVGGGVYTNTVDASASTDNQSQQQHQSYKGFYSNSDGNFNDFWQNCFANYQVNWKNQQAEPETSNEEQEQAQAQQQSTQKQEKPEQAEQKQEAPAKKEAPAQEKPAPEQQQQSAAQSDQLNAYEQQVVELTNNERVERGLDPLKADANLSKMAREKSRDMSANNYFSHTSPNYGSPFDMMKSWGITYSHAGENIARGQRTPEEVVNGWMNSKGHRENILNPDFTHIGVGYIAEGNYWTQEFTG